MEQISRRHSQLDRTLLRLQFASHRLKFHELLVPDTRLLVHTRYLVGSTIPTSGLGFWYTQASAASAPTRCLRSASPSTPRPHRPGGSPMRWAGARVAATVRSKRASSGRLLLAGQAEQVDKVLMKLEPDGMVGVAVRRGEIALIASLEFGERVRETSPVSEIHEHAVAHVFRHEPKRCKCSDQSRAA
jgi:hypothetical protein